LRASARAPLRVSRPATSARPLIAAQWSGVISKRARALGSAPRSSKMAAISVRPWAAAKCKAVQADSSLPSTGAPCASRDRTASAWPAAAACIRAGEAAAALSARAMPSDAIPCRKDSAAKKDSGLAFARTRTGMMRRLACLGRLGEMRMALCECREWLAGSVGLVLVRAAVAGNANRPGVAVDVVGWTGGAAGVHARRCGG
jgi:hypothetical protein